jgi:hypothetical protein
MTLHEGMLPALHGDFPSVGGESDLIRRAGSRERRTMEHDAHMVSIPFIDLEVMRHRIEVGHRQGMSIAYDRDKGNKLADIGFDLLDHRPRYRDSVPNVLRQWRRTRMISFSRALSNTRRPAAMSR